MLGNVTRRYYMGTSLTCVCFSSFYSACLQNIPSGDMWMPIILVSDLLLI
jgi:hypothetical protein